LLRMPRAARKEPDWELAIPHLKIEMQGTQQVIFTSP